MFPVRVVTKHLPPLARAAWHTLLVLGTLVSLHKDLFQQRITNGTSTQRMCRFKPNAQMWPTRCCCAFVLHCVLAIQGREPAQIEPAANEQEKCLFLKPERSQVRLPEPVSPRCLALTALPTPW